MHHHAHPSRRARHRHRHLLALAAVAALSSAAAPLAQAAIAQQSLSFSSASQSIWGSGGSGAFGGSDYVLGDYNFGVSYDARASSGTVRSSLGGQLAANFQSQIDFDQRSAVQVGFDFFGNAGGGSFHTDLGASVSVTAHLKTSLLGIPINWHPTLMDHDYRLDIDKGFTPALAQKTTGSDAFTPASVGVGLPTYGIGLAGGAGVDLDIRQSAQLNVDGLSGVVAARHRDSGDVVTQALSLSNASEKFLSFDLARAGVWDFSYLDLSVANRFTTQFALDILAYVEYGVGIYCGDLGTDDDNFSCTDDRLRANLAGINLFKSPELNLAYGALNTGTAFSLEVMAAPVPEPGTLFMMLAGAGALLTRRRALQAAESS